MTIKATVTLFLLIGSLAVTHASTTRPTCLVSQVEIYYNDASDLSTWTFDDDEVDARHELYDGNKNYCYYGSCWSIKLGTSNNIGNPSLLSPVISTVGYTNLNIQFYVADYDSNDRETGQCRISYTNGSQFNLIHSYNANKALDGYQYFQKTLGSDAADNAFFRIELELYDTYFETDHTAIETLWCMWDELLICGNEITGSPTIITSSPTMITANPTMITGSPTMITANPTIITPSPTMITVNPSTAPSTAPTPCPIGVPQRRIFKYILQENEEGTLCPQLTTRDLKKIIRMAINIASPRSNCIIVTIVEKICASVEIVVSLETHDAALMDEAISNLNAAVGTIITITIGGQEESFQVVSNEELIPVSPDSSDDDDSSGSQSSDFYEIVNGDQENKKFMSENRNTNGKIQKTISIILSFSSSCLYIIIGMIGVFCFAVVISCVYFNINSEN
eukprot:322788_1